MIVNRLLLVLIGKNYLFFSNSCNLQLEILKKNLEQMALVTNSKQTVNKDTVYVKTNVPSTTLGDNIGTFYLVSKGLTSGDTLA